MKLPLIPSAIFTLLVTSIVSFPTDTLAQINRQNIPQAIDLYKSNTAIDEVEQITQVYQLRDLSPSDWSYEALRNLAERYGCIKGFPNRTFQGDKPYGMASLRPITRYEFAAGLNSCLWSAEKIIDRYSNVNYDRINPVTTFIQEIDAESYYFNTKVKEIDSNISLLDDSQFSTTTKLRGEAVFGFGSILAGSTNDGESEIDRLPFLGNQINLELSTSFTGEDELSVELEAANLPELADVTDTFQGELSFSGSNDNNLELDLVAYTFPVGNSLEIVIGATGLAADDIAETINFFEGDNGADGAISNFGGLNPIYETAKDAGLGIIYELGESLEFSAGYLASPTNEPIGEGGIVNAPYGAIAQAIVSPSDRLDLAFTYIHSRNQSDTDTGSDLANVRSFTEDEFDEAVPTVSDSYGVEFSYELSDFIAVGGWGGLSKITTWSSLEGQIDRGTQDVWNWAVTLAFPDLGKEGNLGGIVIGAEPWVTDSSINNLGEDEISLHLEAFYQYRLSDNLAITPGIVCMTAPSNNNLEVDLVIGAIRTTFTF